jgi:hypothetical protein
MPRSSQHKELEQRLERKINGLFIIHEIGRALQRTTDPDEILYIVLVGVTAGEALKCNRLGVALASLIAIGYIISGSHVQRSILSSRVRGHSYAQVYDSN